ncbi:MAG: tetratricopeptide repeat protein, partial [Candidatus Bathyarchaeota archaeon]
MSEEIITHLSEIPQLFVIASYSTFACKGLPFDIPKIIEYFGVRYVLKGSATRSGERLRVSVQLIDAKTEHDLWSENYDREFREILAIQNEIVTKSLATLKIELTSEEQARLFAGEYETQDMKAYDKVLLGTHHSRRFDRDGNVMARKLFEEAVRMDPDYARAYSLLASTHLMDALMGYSKSRRKSLEEAAKYGQKALILDDSLSLAHAFLALVYLRHGQYDKAISAGERAMALNPNDPDVKVTLASILNKVGRTREALPLVRKAVRLTPFTPFWYFEQCGQACAPEYTQQEVLKSQVINYGPGYFLFRDKTIPKESAMRVFYYKPESYTVESPIFFFLHGYGRWAETIYEHVAESSEKHGFLLIVPEYSFALFPTFEEYNYGNARKEPKELWTYYVNDRIFRFVKKLTNSAEEKYSMLGHSAGSQFVHRQLIVGASDLVEKAFAANAGEYAMPVFGEDPFPWSLTRLEVTREDLKKLFSVKLYVLLGEADVKQEWYFPKGTAATKQGRT